MRLANRSYVIDEEKINMAYSMIKSEPVEFEIITPDQIFSTKD